MNTTEVQAWLSQISDRISTLRVGNLEFRWADWLTGHLSIERTTLFAKLICIAIIGALYLLYRYKYFPRAGQFAFKLCVAPTPSWYLHPNQREGRGACRAWKIDACSKDDRKNSGVEKSDGLDFFQARRKCYGFFLYPDRLRLWMWRFALIMSLPLLFVSWSWCAVCLCVFAMAYWLVFIRRRHPVLTTAWNKCPASLRGWLLSLSQRIDLHSRDFEALQQSRHPMDQRTRILFRSKPRRMPWLRRFHEWLVDQERNSASKPVKWIATKAKTVSMWLQRIGPTARTLRRWIKSNMRAAGQSARSENPRHRMKSRSFRPPPYRQAACLPRDFEGDAKPQKIFLRAAVMDLFQSRSDQRISYRLINWIAYWCAPSWIGYAVLLLPLAWHFTTGYAIEPHDAKHLALASGTWVALSFFFLWRQFHFITAHEWTIKPAELDPIPLELHPHLPRTQGPSLLNIQAKMVFAVIYAAALTLYLQLLHLSITQ